MMRAPTRALLIALACLALPATAQAAAPFTAGTGEQPSVAVGADGSGHVAWETTEEPVKVGYCRLSAETSACNRSELLSFPGTEAYSAGRAQIFTPSANKVVIVAGCWECPTGAEDKVYHWVSTNNGDSFSGPFELGYDLGNDGFGAWLDELGIFVAANSSSVKAQQGPIATPGTGVQFATGGVFVFNSEAARLQGENTLVATTNDLDTIKYAVYNGSPLTVSNVNNAANWASDLTLLSPESDNSDTALNSGPNGIFLSYLNYRPNDSQVALRRFDQGTGAFGLPVYVAGADPIDADIDFSEPDSFQDPAGRIHVVWDSQYEDNRLRYTVSDTGGANFSAPETLAANEGFYEPEVAAGADGHGFATWTPSTEGAIRVVPLDPHPESAPSPPSEGTSPAPSPTTAPPSGSPHIGGLRTSDSILAPGQALDFSFHSNRAGSAVLTIEKAFKGVKGTRPLKKPKRMRRNPKAKGKQKKTCLPLTHKRLRALRRKAHSPRAFRRLLKKRSCHGFRRIGQITQRVSQGNNTIRFDGRIAGRKLGPGSYRASLVVTDDAGHVSRTETTRFKVVSKHRKGKRNKRRHHR